MAEPANGGDTYRSATRPMTDEEARLVHSPMNEPVVYKSVATVDTRLNPDSGVYRAMRDDLADQESKSQGQKKTPMEEDVALTVIRPLEISLMNLRLKIEAKFAELEKTLTPLQNMDPMFDNRRKRAIGNYYFHGNHCEFLMQMYNTQENEPLLDFRRMSGDGFVMDTFFREVKDTLSAFTVTPVEDDADEEDTFDDYSDDDDENATSMASDIGELLKNGGFLQLQYDKHVVKNWLKKIRKGHIQDRNYLMGLLAHNSRNSDNRAIIIAQGAGELLEVLETQLSSTDSAAMARNCSLLLQQIVLDGVNIHRDLAKSVFQALERWVPGNRHTQTLEVTESREAVLFLSSALRILSDKNKNFDIPTLQGLKQEVFSEDPHDAEATLTKYVQGARLNSVDPAQNADYDFVLKILQD